MYPFVFQHLKRLIAGVRAGRSWARKTLVVGPSQPVDGDSVACTRALISHLRKLGGEAYTLPVLSMYPQLQWILEPGDLHSACRPFADDRLVTANLQEAYDALLAQWRPDEIVLVDGQPDRLGFDPRGVRLFTIDHHLDHGSRDDRDAYVQAAPSAGCLLIARFGVYEPILSVSILTDTFWLRQNLPAQAIDSLCALRARGLTDEILIDLQRKLIVLKDPEIIWALSTCDFRRQGQAAFVVIKSTQPEIHRGVCAEMGYFFSHFCVVRGDGYVSFKTTDVTRSVLQLAITNGGGGHHNMAAGQLQSLDPEQLDKLYAEFMALFGDGRR